MARKRTKTKRRNPREASSVDAHVGQRVRQRRTILGMSQTMLGEALGLTFQQIQKYERGSNRVGASRLFELCRVLGVPLGYFFEGLEPDATPIPASSIPDEMKANADPLSRRETLELVRAFDRIQDPALRRKLYDLIRQMSGMPDLQDELDKAA